MRHVQTNRRVAHQWPAQRWLTSLSILSILLSLITYDVQARPSLRGSASSLDRQNRAANQASLKRHRTPRELMKSVKRGKLVRVTGRGRFELHNVSYPYAHPDLKTFLGQLARAFQRVCRLDLVVTSLARPISTQPRNASIRSVHPTGIAADLRLPPKFCRAKLEPILLRLEEEGVIEATRERRPPHYHITINPPAFRRALRAGGGKLEALTQRARSRAPRATKRRRTVSRRARHHHSGARSKASRGPYRVRSGDTLWGLAQRWKVTVASIKRVNRLRSTKLSLGQLLKIP